MKYRKGLALSFRIIDSIIMEARTTSDASEKASLMREAEIMIEELRIQRRDRV